MRGVILRLRLCQPFPLPFAIAAVAHAMIHIAAATPADTRPYAAYCFAAARYGVADATPRAAARDAPLALPAMPLFSPR